MIVEEGLNSMLRSLLRDSAIGGSIGLFSNDLTPADDTVFADLTEPGFPGYAQQLCTSLVWPNPAINGSGESESDGPVITFTASSAPGSPVTIYGIFCTVTDNADVVSLFLCYRFPESIDIVGAGDQVLKRINWFCDNY
jgi:hypothetical protein